MGRCRAQIVIASGEFSANTVRLTPCRAGDIGAHGAKGGLKCLYSLAKAILSKDGIKQVSFLPMMIDKQYRPEVLRNGDPRFHDMVDYMEWASDGFSHKFTVDGDQVVVEV